MMKTVVVFAVAVLFFTSSGSAYNLFVSTLPFEYNQSLDVGNVTNRTFVYSGFLSGNSSFNDSNVSVIKVNIVVPVNTSAGNYTWNVTKNYNASVEDVYLFNFSIINDSVTEFIQTDVNGFEYSTCDVTLPFNATRRVVVKSTHDAFVNVTCSHFDFLSCQEGVTTGGDGYGYHDIKIDIPKGTSAGAYQYVVQYNVSGLMTNVKFDLKVEKCLIPPEEIEYYLQFCNYNSTPTVETYLRCLAALAEASKYINIQNDRLYNFTPDELTVFKNVTEYVPVLRLDRETAKLFSILSENNENVQNLLVENDQSQELNEELLTKQRELELQFANYTKTIDQKVEQRVSSLVKTNTELTRQNIELEDTTVHKGTFYNILVGIAVIIIGTTLFLYLRNEVSV